MRFEVHVEVEVVSDQVAADRASELFDLLVDGLDMAPTTHVCSEGLAAGRVGAGKGLLT